MQKVTKNSTVVNHPKFRWPNFFDYLAHVFGVHNFGPWSKSCVSRRDSGGHFVWGHEKHCLICDLVVWKENV